MKTGTMLLCGIGLLWLVSRNKPTSSNAAPVDAISSDPAPVTGASSVTSGTSSAAVLTADNDGAAGNAPSNVLPFARPADPGKQFTLNSDPRYPAGSRPAE